MTDYETFLDAVVLNWDHACEYTWKHQAPSGSKSLKPKDYVNFRASKHGVVEAAQKGGLTLRTNQIFELINEAIVKNDIVPAHGHYRLSPNNVEKFLNAYAKVHTGSFDVSSLMRRCNKRTTKVPLGLYASSVADASERSSEPTTAAVPSKEAEKIVDKLQTIKRSLGGFARLWDCLRNQVSLDGIADMDINDDGNLEIQYEDGTEKLVLAAAFLSAWEVYNSHAKMAEAEAEASQ